ncbi:39S ribosomal protein L37, mitochondrial, partial [Trichinella sp. T8]
LCCLSSAVEKKKDIMHNGVAVGLQFPTWLEAVATILLLTNATIVKAAFVSFPQSMGSTKFNNNNNNTSKESSQLVQLLTKAVPNWNNNTTNTNPTNNSENKKIFDHVLKMQINETEDNVTEGVKPVEIDTNVLIWHQRLNPSAVRVRWYFSARFTRKHNITGSLVLYTSDASLEDHKWKKIIVIEPRHHLTIGDLDANKKYYVKVFPRTSETTILLNILPLIVLPYSFNSIHSAHFNQSTEAAFETDRKIGIQEHFCLKICNLTAVSNQCLADEKCILLSNDQYSLPVCLPVNELIKMTVRHRPIKQWGRFNTKIFKKLFDKKMKTKVEPFVIPESLEAMNIKVEDPNDPNFGLKSNATNKLPMSETLIPQGTRCFLFDGSESLAEGILQALHITNAVGRKGLPSSTMNLLDFESTVSLEERIRKAAMQANIWDATLVSLPERRDPALWWISWPRYHGIPVLKKSAVLVDFFFRCALTLAANHPEVKDLRYTRDALMKAFIAKGGETLLCFKQQPMMTVTGPRPLEPVLSKEAVLKTIEEPLVSIHPVGELIDFTEENISEIENIWLGIVSAGIAPSSFPSVHTILTVKDKDYRYPWTSKEMTGNAILSCFTAALISAIRQYGDYCGVLERPIVSQCIQCCENKFDFITFQLNTTDLTKSDGVKNVVWYDGDNQLFKSLPYWDQFVEVEEANANVLRKFLAMVFNCCKC